MKTITAINKPNYRVDFKMERYNTGWKVSKILNNDVVETRYCLSKKHAKRTMRRYENEFWLFRLN